MWCLRRAPLLLSREFLRDLGCHIDLGRGHLFFEKLGVRTVVTSKQSPHLLLPLTSFGPQGHKIPAEIQPRISSDECAIVPLMTVPNRTKYIRGSPQHLTTEHQKLTVPTLNPCMERMDRRKPLAPVMKRETTGKIEKDGGPECTVSPEEHHSTQCTMNSLFARTSLATERDDD